MNNKKEAINQREMTYVEKLVGLNYNPNNNVDVTRVKRHIADLIDQLNIARSETNNPEIKRMMSIAITDLQNAQMWIVKALTWIY